MMTQRILRLEIVFNIKRLKKLIFTHKIFNIQNIEIQHDIVKVNFFISVMFLIRCSF